MDALFVVGLIVVIVVVVALSRAHQSRANAAWQAAARSLGFHFHPSKFLTSRKIMGPLRENRVVVDTFTRSSGKHSVTYTRYRVHLTVGLPEGLRLTKEGFLSGIGKVFGAQDIEVGDTSFDGDVLVKGDRPSDVREFLTPTRQVRIHRALQSYSGLTIGESEIRWDKRGHVTDADQIVATVHALTRLAWFLCGDREEDQPLTTAMTERRAGRLAEAIQAIHAVEVTEERPQPVEERAFEGEMLQVAGRTEKAAEKFRMARSEAPDDPEIREWAEHLDSPPPEPPVPPTPEEPTAGPTPESVCEALFGDGRGTLAASRIFDERFAGLAVRWPGVLKNVESYSYDFVFGQGPGVKAVVEVHEIQADLYGTKQIQAVVQLPSEAGEHLKGREGETVVFAGNLRRVDGLMRNLYVSEGSCPPPTSPAEDDVPR